MNNDEFLADVFGDNYLAHYGVKGMKWGVRKNPVTGNGRKVSSKVKARLKRVSKRTISSAKSNVEATKARIKERMQRKKDKKQLNRELEEVRSEGKKNSKTLNTRQIKDMSNDELRARINRIKLENEYLEKTRTRSDKTKNRIKSAVADSVKEVSKEKGKEYLKAFVDYEMHGGKATNESFTKYLNRNNKKEDPELSRMKKEIDRIKTQNQYDKLTSKGSHFKGNTSVSGAHSQYSKKQEKAVQKADKWLADNSDVWSIAFDELDWR